ncbi:MAG: 4-hydroxybutyrate--acetyl-CoA CoA transferase [Firmicutes bacterium HGW-Firmicutes-4]|jgi:acyl-CoA hydrolase|nr:MAG: 4-hydroxybutyrate--acetyl-CoA CoA transferase [Firmicutes bacterium HGW-Firmicutes-4]
MNYKELLDTKTITIEEAVGKITNGATIYTYGIAEPMAYMDQFHLLKDRGVKGVTHINLLNLKPYDFYSDETYDGILNHVSGFYGNFMRDPAKTKMTTFYPNHLSKSGTDRLYYHQVTGKPVSIFTLSVSPMDKQGYFSTGPICVASPDYLKKADLVILEINENIPRTFGDTQVHISDVDYVLYGNNEVMYLPSRNAASSGEDILIGKHIADMIEDGSTLQLGIGGIPNAVAMALKDKKDLGVHTEMLNDGLVQLYKEGIVTNRCKTLYKNKMITSFTFGTKETYDFIDDNVGVLHINVRDSNSPFELAKNHKMISVNTTLQVDLFGQCSSEAIGTRHISGTGGQVETAQGAKMSKDGKSFIALHSTANVKNASGERVLKSTIVDVHPEGTVITLSRADVDYVVTEYGVAALRGASLIERAKALISIAHPDFRDELEENAKKRNILR